MEVGDVDLNDWDIAFGTLTTPEPALPDRYEFSPAELERLQLYRAAFRAGLYSDGPTIGDHMAQTR